VIAPILPVRPARKARRPRPVPAQPGLHAPARDPRPEVLPPAMDALAMDADWEAFCDERSDEAFAHQESGL
jgi:hypothetical protein